MTSDVTRTYRTTAFAALAGVTPRALRHYDRLGLLKPRRSPAGYHLYTERDLQTLEEIVALEFIGVPLKEIAAIRRRDTGPFVQLLRAQLETLRARRRVLTRAIDAIAVAEASLRAGATPGRFVVPWTRVSAQWASQRSRYACASSSDSKRRPRNGVFFAWPTPASTLLGMGKRQPSGTRSRSHNGHSVLDPR